MKRFAKVFACACAAAVVAAGGFSGCGGRSTLLARAADPQRYEYTQQGVEARDRVIKASNDFAERFTRAVLQGYDGQGNVALSPASVFTALAMTVTCSDGQTKDELISVLGIGEEELSAGFGRYFSELNIEYTGGKVAADNSIWLGEGYEFSPDSVQKLANEYFCSSYAADFKNDNERANLAVREYVRDNTEGLIDTPFNLSYDTACALVNTLLLKDNWNFYGDELPLTSQQYAFTAADGRELLLNLIEGNYNPGIAVEGENFTAFYTSTANSFKIHFILPDEGVSVGEAFDAGALNTVIDAGDYNATDEANKVKNYTRALFPAFDGSYAGSINDALKDMGITSLFGEGCNLTRLMPGGGVCCNSVAHVAKFSVDRRGIEGAAATVADMGPTAADPGEYEKKYYDFIVKRAFGYAVTSPCGAVLFTGVVNNV